MMAAILNSAIMNFAILGFSHFAHIWVKLIQSDLNSFILTQLDDVSYLNSAILVPTILNTKKTSLIHSDSGWL